MHRLSRLVKYNVVLIVAYLSILVISFVLYHLGIVTQESTVATILTVVTMICFGAVAILLVKTFREVGRELGVICFKNGRCIALDDIALIYIEPRERH
jgi:hypothetical protein